MSALTTRLLVLGAVLFGVMTIIGYLTKVTKPKYPPRGQG